MVAVAGAKGSPGCTFVAVNLALRLAEDGLETLIADADAEDRGAAAMLEAPPGPEPGLLARAVRLGGLDAALVRRSAVPVGPRLRLLEVAAGEPPALDGRELAAVAREERAAVVIDLGHLHGPLQRQLAAAADWLLWVVRADRQGLERADRLLGAGCLGGASPGLVLNRLSGGSLRGAEAVLTERHPMPVMARLPERPSAGAQAHRARPFRAAFRDLARTVHPDAQAEGTAWP